MSRRLVGAALLLMSGFSQGAIYQCGNVFQGHPCAGAVVRQGAPTTNLSQTVPSQQSIQTPNFTVSRHQCKETVIASVSNNGAIIQTAGGHIFHIGSYGQFDSQIWESGDELLVCATSGTMNGKPITTYSLRDLNSGDSHSHLGMLLK